MTGSTFCIVAQNVETLVGPNFIFMTFSDMFTIDRLLVFTWSNKADSI